MKEVTEDIKCSKCRGHAMQYLTQNPIEPFFKYENGCLYWTWVFHNTVNARLGDKRQVTWEEAKLWYLPSHELEPCDVDCGDENKINRITPITLEILGFPTHMVGVKKGYPLAMTDPKIFGLGLWCQLHDRGRRATLPDRQADFVNYVNEVVDDLKCLTCYNHALAYVRENPIQPYFNLTENGIYVGCAKWVWQFHNAVNSRLNKENVTWEKCLELFPILGQDYELTVCTDDCGQNKLQPISFLASGWPTPNNWSVPKSITHEIPI